MAKTKATAAEAAANGADILVAATNAITRVIPPEWMRPDGARSLVRSSRRR